MRRTPDLPARLRAGGALIALTLLATVLSLVAGPTAPAAADSRSALDKCLAGAAPDHVQTVVHPGGRPGTSYPDRPDPDNEILPGDVVRVTAWGSMRYDLWGNTVGPQGRPEAAPADWPFPGLPKLSSIARWNTKPGGWVGSPMTTTSLSRCTSAPTSHPVRLLYQVNDNEMWDNGGSWSIRTEVFRAPGRVAVEDVEVTQGIQTPDGRVPLLAGKNTFVRAYVKATDDGRGPMSGVTATLRIDGSSRVHGPVNASSITASYRGSDRRSLVDSFVFQLDPAALGTGTRRLTVTVHPPSGRGDGRPWVRTAEVTFAPATSLHVYGARYSYYNVPLEMQRQRGLTSSYWQARPASVWEQMRVTAENALPLSRLSISDLDASATWGHVWIDCRAVRDAAGTWGCAGYEQGQDWIEAEADRRCPDGGCWFAVLQPESDPGHYGAQWRTGRGNVAINLQGEPTEVERGLTLAHEIGHGLGLQHTWEDSSFPRSDGGLGPFVALRVSPRLATVSGRDATGASTAFDTMSYSSPSWFSPYSYCKALSTASRGATTCPGDLRG